MKKMQCVSCLMVLVIWTAGGQCFLSENFEKETPRIKMRADIQPGKKGNALFIEKENDFAEISIGNNFPLREGTIDFWVKLTKPLDKKDPDSNILSVVGTPDYWNRYQLTLSPRRKSILFNLVPGRYAVPNQWAADFIVYASIADWKTGEWHRITATWENLNSGKKDAQVILYVDGKMKKSRIGNLTVTKLGKTMILGKDRIVRIPGYPMAIDSLVVTESALSAEEIASGKPLAMKTKLPEAAKPITVKRFDKQESFISMKKTNLAPVLDGRIVTEDKGWWSAVYTRGLIDSESGEMLFSKAVFRIMYDDENLYVSLWGVFPGQAPKDKSKYLDNHSVNLLLKHNDDLYEFGVCANGIQKTTINGSAKQSNWKSALTIHDSGEVGGTALTFSKSVWQIEMQIPLKQFGLKAHPAHELWKMNFLVNYPEGIKNRKLSWAMITDKANPVSGNIKFADGDLPHYIDCDVAEIGNGNINVEVKRNHAPKAALWYIKTSLLQSEKKEPYFAHSFPLTFAVNKGKMIKYNYPISFKKSGKLLFTYSIKDIISGKTLFQRACNYLSRISLKIDPVVLYSRDLLRVNIDLSAFTPLKEGTNCNIKLVNKNAKGVLETDLKVDLKSGKGYSDLDIAKIDPASYRLQIKVADKSKVIGEIEKNVTIHPKPKWWKNDLGKNTKLYDIWTPLQVKKNTVSIWNRDYTFSKLPFPSAIKAAGSQLLSGPIGLKVIEANGRVSWKKGKMKIQRISELEAIITCEALSKKIILEGKSTVEFDGFTRIDWTLKPVSADVELRKVELVIPFKTDNMLYMKGLGVEDWRSDNYGVYSAALYPTTPDPKYGSTLDVHEKWKFSTKGWIWPDKFCHELWIGNDESGVSFMFDSPVNWKTKKYIQTRRNGNALELVFTILDQKFKLKEPLKYSMAIQATPVKPLPKDPKRWRFCYRGGDYAKGAEDLALAVQYRTMRGPGWPKFTKRGKKILDNWAKGGVKLTSPFYSNITTLEMPECQIFKREWEIIPKISWSFGWRHGSGGTGVMVSLNGNYGDFYVHAANQLIDQGAKGIYIDSAGVIATTNEYSGSGYVDSNGKRQPTIGLFKTREVYKRLFNLFKQRVPDSLIWVHCTPITALASFTDATTEGEEWTDFKRKEKWKFDIGYLTPDFFRIGYMPFGYRGVPFCFYPGLPRGYPKHAKQEDMLPISLAHNVFPLNYGYPLIKKTWELMNGWYTSSKWIPYWKNSHMIKSFASRVKVSVYAKKKEHKYLLLFANTLDKEQYGKATINLKEFGMTSKNAVLRAVVPGEKEAGKVVRITNGKFRVDLPKLRCGFFLLERKK